MSQISEIFVILNLVAFEQKKPQVFDEDVDMEKVAPVTENLENNLPVEEAKVTVDPFSKVKKYC